jgi:hypothetical protein
MNIWKWSAVMILAVSASCAQNGDVKLNQVKSNLQTNLPVGSSPEQVANYVNKMGYTSDGPLSASDLLPSMSNPNILEMPSIIRDTRRLWPMSYSVTMVFQFDRERKLKDIVVDEVGTGP